MLKSIQKKRPNPKFISYQQCLDDLDHAIKVVHANRSIGYTMVELPNMLKNRYYIEILNNTLYDIDTFEKVLISRECFISIITILTLQYYPQFYTVEGTRLKHKI